MTINSGNLAIANQCFLEPAGLEYRHLEKLLARLSGPSVDLADLYFQAMQHESWVLEDGQVKDASFNIRKGVGVRAVAGEQSGFAYSDAINLAALEQAAGAAGSIARLGQDGRVRLASKAPVPALYEARNPLLSRSPDEKIALLREMDQRARSADPRIVQVVASLSGVHDTLLIAASDGTLQADVRPLVRINISVVAEQEGRRERASAGAGGRFDYIRLLEEHSWQDLCDEAVRQALLNLEAVEAPAGVMPVVLGPGWPGVLLHEAIGHGLEGDFNRKGSSAFSGRIGERVASDVCTVVDHGAMEGRRGSLSVDDEGTPTGCTTLIEKGILRGYLQDKQNARLMNQQPTGNGRRESYAHLPMPRMTNTYMLAGDSEPEEIIASVDKGIYAVNFAGGQVDITSGKFVFSASEAWLIENGRLTAPIKGATLIGNGPDVLTRVSMVGNDLQLDAGIGVCGKEGQSVPVGVGQPTLRVDELTVGGTA